MKAIARFLTIRLMPEPSAGMAGQLICYAAALAFLCVGFGKLAALDLNEKEALFGILLVLAVGLLMVVLGMLVNLTSRPPR